MASTNNPPTQTPMVPPLNIPIRLSIDTSLPIPSRYSTVVSVEYYINDDVRHIKWFSDIQMAWIWINHQVRQYHGEEWEVCPFLTIADSMDYEWRQGNGHHGMVVAYREGYEYAAYYEPTINYEDVRDREEHF